jgi:hypothetical protein
MLLSCSAVEKGGEEEEELESLITHAPCSCLNSAASERDDDEKKRSKDRRDVSSKSSATKTRKKSSSRPTQAHESVIDLNISFAFYLTNFPTHRIAMIRTRGLYVNREASQREARETTRSRSNRKSRARKRHKSNIGD